MKVLVVGNHTCGNRGDAAILRGLLAELREQEVEIQVDVITRYVTSSSFLLSECVEEDSLYHYHRQTGSLISKVWNAIGLRLLPKLLHRAFLKKSNRLLPNHIKRHIASLESYDAVLQVGGSFFVDFYGASQFEHVLCALIAKVPVYMVGHSVGPFTDKGFVGIAKTVFSNVEILSLREELSRGMMLDAGISIDRVHAGADTAWLVPNTLKTLPSELHTLVSKKPAVAITMRELAPFDKRLGVDQVQYERAFANLASSLINEGYQVIVCSTCTGIESYHKDDRMVALRVQKLVNLFDDIHVVMDELNDVQLGTLLGMCELTIGTRLHSAIISMNYGTTALALNYEHKSAGILAQMGLSGYAFEVKSLFDGTLDSAVLELLSHLNEGQSSIIDLVEGERIKARKMVSEVLKNLNEKSK